MRIPKIRALTPETMVRIEVVRAARRRSLAAVSDAVMA
jgi:hypothetical protein